VKRRPGLKPAVTAAAVAVCLACVALTWRQVGYWRDTITLFQRPVRHQRELYRIQRFGLGVQGQGRLDEAIANFRKPFASVRITRTPTSTWPSAAQAGPHGESLDQAAAAAISSPKTEVQYNLGPRWPGGQIRGSHRSLPRRRALKPDYAKAHANLGSALAVLDAWTRPSRSSPKRFASTRAWPACARSSTAPSRCASNPPRRGDNTRPAAQLTRCV